MKTDLYTKIILTVIALVLTINLVKDFSLVPTVQAAAAPIPDPAPAKKEIVDVNIVQMNGIDMFPRTILFNDKTWSLLPVSLENHNVTPLDVNLEQIDGSRVCAPYYDPYNTSSQDSKTLGTTIMNR